MFLNEYELKRKILLWALEARPKSLVLFASRDHLLYRLNDWSKWSNGDKIDGEPIFCLTTENGDITILTPAKDIDDADLVCDTSWSYSIDPISNLLDQIFMAFNEKDKLVHWWATGF